MRAQHPPHLDEDSFPRARDSVRMSERKHDDSTRLCVCSTVRTSPGYVPNRKTTSRAASCSVESQRRLELVEEAVIVPGSFVLAKSVERARIQS
jgi:hypothetical protein